MFYRFIKCIIIIYKYSNIYFEICKILKYIFFDYIFVYIFNLGGFWKGGGPGMTGNRSVGWHTYHQNIAS